MPIEISLLVGGLAALRILAIVLCLAMIAWWGPAFLRSVRGRDRNADAKRAIWVPLAVGVLVYQAGWLYPGMHAVDRLRVFFVAQIVIVATLLAAIYINGADHDGFRPRRAMKLHLAMFATSIALALLAR